jgi:hypothetical protein
MSLPDINARQLKLICAYDLRNALRSGSGLVYTVLATFFGLIVANAIISPFEAFASRLGQNDPVAFERSVVGLARPVVQWALGSFDSGPDTAAWVDYLLTGRPALLSAIFVVLLFGTPLLIPFGSFNQTSGDIGNRGLRYLLLRTERVNIYYGRLISSMILAIGVQILVIALIALYLGLKVHVYDGIDIFTWSLQGLFALCVLTLPYVALCAWLSASTDSPMTSLVIANAVIGGVLLGAFLVARQWEIGSYLAYLLPWGVQKLLLKPENSTVLLAAAACLGYTAVFAWLGQRKFGTRDL